MSRCVSCVMHLKMLTMRPGSVLNSQGVKLISRWLRCVRRAKPPAREHMTCTSVQRVEVRVLINRVQFRFGEGRQH